jgi:hypothetical protein
LTKVKDLFERSRFYSTFEFECEVKLRRLKSCEVKLVSGFVVVVKVVVVFGV